VNSSVLGKRKKLKWARDGEYRVTWSTGICF